MPAASSTATVWRALVLAAPGVLVAAALLALAPIAQDPAYHRLADDRVLLGIPRFGDVVTNLAFLAVGGAGLARCLGHPLPGARASWTVLFAGVLLVAPGSTWYHLAPTDARLVWDRLPMAVGFMGLFSALLAEHLHPRVERFALPVLLALGPGTVAWWAWTGDLRPYAWVQLAPLGTIVALIALVPGRYPRRGWLLAGLALYLLAKMAENADATLWAASGELVSGHSVKHLLAALAVACPLAMLWVRPPPPPVAPARGSATLAQATPGDGRIRGGR